MYIKYREIHYIGAPPAPLAVLELTIIGTPSPGGGWLSNYSTSISNACVVRGSQCHDRKQVFLSCLGSRLVIARAAITAMRLG